MYRSCSTWQYGVAGQLIEKHRGVSRLGFVDGSRFAIEVEPEFDRSGWGILKAHDAHEHYAGLLAEGRAKGIYSHRDLRDVAFSWVHKTGLSFDEIVANGFLDRCLRNDRFWRSQPGILLQSYERLFADPVRGVAEIADHLGFTTGSGEAESIAGAFSFEANRKRTSDLAERMVAQGIPLSSKDQDSYDPGSLLHWNHLRTGKVGDWREQATPDQMATLGRICGSWLIDNGYELDDSWARAADGGRSPAPAQLRRVSYAANGEDILLDRVFRGKPGTFLEIGAGHPRKNNRTYFFYLRGWRGLSVEPASGAREIFESIRPGDYNLAYAVLDEAGEQPFFEIPGHEDEASLSREVAERHLDRGHPVIERRVLSRTVADLVGQFGLVEPEICSIAVAADAERIVRGIPLATWRPKVFVIDTPKRDLTLPHPLWEPVLLEQGYRFATYDGISRYYVRADLADALPHFQLPVNPSDAFERAETVELRAQADSFQRLYERERLGGEEARAELAKARWANDQNLGLHRSERDAWQRERDAVQRERDAWQAERDAWQVERDAFTREQDAWQVERDAVQRERDAWQRERDAWQRERDEVARRFALQANDLRQLRDDLARLNFARDAERARFDREHQARADEVEEARSQLRPYRLIDRFGVVTALHRRVRGVKSSRRP